MLKSSILILPLFAILCITLFMFCKQAKKSKEISKNGKDSLSSLPKPTPSDFYSINDGNQDKLVFAPDYDSVWFQKTNKKYSWEEFNVYDNKFYEYMYNLFDTLPALSKGKTNSDREFFDSLTRGQKIFYSILVFGGDTDNGGVYQFFFNRPEFCLATLEAFKELKLDTIRQDYEKCLNEFIGTSESYAKRKTIFNNESIGWETKAKSFSDGYGDIKSAKKLEAYFYTDEFKKYFFKAVTDYIDGHLEQFVRK